MNNKRKTNKAFLTVIGSLCDFIPEQDERIERTLDVPLFLNPSVKDIIESTGIPHVEIFGITINGEPATLCQNLLGDDHITVYPIEELMGDEPYILRNPTQSVVKFAVDVHLGALVKDLRLLGVDTFYRNEIADQELVTISNRQNRCVLTRDIGLLKRGSLKNGYWVRTTQPDEQLYEIINRFDLSPHLKPFTRCLSCNGNLTRVDKSDIEDQIPSKVSEWAVEFNRCHDCDKVYWKGSHYKDLKSKVQSIYQKLDLAWNMFDNSN